MQAFCAVIALVLISFRFKLATDGELGELRKQGELEELCAVIALVLTILNRQNSNRNVWLTWNEI